MKDDSDGRSKYAAKHLAGRSILHLHHRKACSCKLALSSMLPCVCAVKPFAHARVCNQPCMGTHE